MPSIRFWSVFSAEITVARRLFASVAISVYKIRRFLATARTGFEGVTTAFDLATPRFFFRMRRRGVS